MSTFISNNEIHNVKYLKDRNNFFFVFTLQCCKFGDKEQLTKT